MGSDYRKENTNNTILYTKCRSYITLYNTFSIYDSVNENTITPLYTQNVEVIYII